jgi:hypothetical protein
MRLEIAPDRPPLTAVSDVNAALAEVGAGAWPLDLDPVPDEIRRLLGRPALTEAEVTRVREHFQLPRPRLLEIIGAAGRSPHVAGGGALTTSVSNQGYAYPQLWVVQGGVDYTRFDRFHVNIADDGTGVDEVLQVLSGRGVVIRLRRPGGAHPLALRLDCPSPAAGWLVTYDGGRPHIGSLSGASSGTTVMVQAIGPARWAVRYRD